MLYGALTFFGLLSCYDLLRPEGLLLLNGALSLYGWIFHDGSFYYVGCLMTQDSFLHFGLPYCCDALKYNGCLSYNGAILGCGFLFFIGSFNVIGCLVSTDALRHYGQLERRGPIGLSGSLIPYASLCETGCLAFHGGAFGYWVTHHRWSVLFSLNELIPRCRISLYLRCRCLIARSCLDCLGLL